MRLRFAILLALLCTPALAKVGANEAEQLRTRLTPLGAERVGNEDGTLPEWQGGLLANPPCHVPGARYCDPYAEDRPYVTITGGTREEWRDFLSAGHLAMLEKHRKTFRMELYPSRRSFANPGAVYDAAYQNATRASLTTTGNGVRDAAVAVPFPIPKSGAEVLWNHKLRWRGPASSRWLKQASVSPSGEATYVSFREDAESPFSQGTVGEDGVVQRFLWLVLQPQRLLGFLTLSQDTLDADAAPAAAWQQQPASGEGRRIRKSRSFGFDNPAMLSDDLRFDDQYDGFFGSPERYVWRTVARREMVVPYNAYRLHSGRGDLRETLRPAHLDPALARYELHRVWVVEATLKPKALHRAKRRTFYFDEDSWQILMVDLYDRSDRLWRLQEIHPLMAYDRATLVPALEAVYDLESSRYLVQGIGENQPERAETAFDPEHFTPAGAREAAPE